MKRAREDDSKHPSASLLEECGQEHILAAVAEDERDLLYAQVASLDRNYPTGLKGYVSNAKALLAASAACSNPLAGVVSVEVPEGKTLRFGAEEYKAFEELGITEIPHVCFVLVAGGLGERLGYSGIKLSLPIDLATEQSYLGLYCESVLALQSKASAQLQQNVEIPFVIMTSDDTHARTVALLEENRNFGLVDGQIQLLKQEKVAALSNADAAMVLNKDRKSLLSKPHGHGDIHMLLHSSGLARQWAAEGKHYVAFFQDTNGLVFRSMLAVLGVSKSQNFHLNSMCVPRMAKQEIGAITRLVYEDGKTVTANTEYNQLGPLLKALGSGEGDVPDATGYSPFPGNINQLVVALDLYVEVLSKTNGVMEEFVNPKYKDETRLTFKKPTRLECMMQDYSKVLPPSANVGFTTNEQWLGYSPAKNSIYEGLNKMKAGVAPMCPATAEADMYNVNAECWKRHGAKIGTAIDYIFCGIPVKLGPILSITPRFAISSEDLAASLPNPSNVQISSRSALVITGEGCVVIESLELDGALEIRTGRGANVIIRDLSVTNQGWHFKELMQEELQNASEEIRIRGYRMEKIETELLEYLSPGNFVKDKMN